MKPPKKKVKVNKSLSKPVSKPTKKDQPNKDLITLGKRIQSLRVKRGYTNYEYFAYENDIPRAQYGRYEKGEDLRYTSLIRVVKAMGISMKEFFSEGFD